MNNYPGGIFGNHPGVSRGEQDANQDHCYTNMSHGAPGQLYIILKNTKQYFPIGYDGIDPCGQQDQIGGIRDTGNQNNYAGDHHGNHNGDGELTK